MDEQLKACAQRAIGEKVFPGCVIGYVRRDGTRTILPLGNYKYVTSSAVKARTIYDLASITKSIPLASLALTFIAEGKLSQGDPVKKYLPELQHDHGATIEDLLRYRVRGPRLSTLHYATFEEVRGAILEKGFEGPAGEEHYANAPALLLGIVLERVGGSILPALANRYFFEPLHMLDATFFPFDKRRIVPTEVLAPVHYEIRGIVHDESARLFAMHRRAVGHAGLFATAPDLLNFLEALLNVGHPMSYIVEGAQKGLGWEVDKEWMGRHRREKTFGKTGFTGTSILCDVERGIGLVILSNRTYPHRPPDNSAINLFRRDIADIVFEV